MYTVANPDIPTENNIILLHGGFSFSFNFIAMPYVIDNARKIKCKNTNNKTIKTYPYQEILYPF